MSRDDSLLNTGMTSASFATVRTNKVREDAREVKAEKRSKLTPAAELVQEEIQKEIDKLLIVDYKVVKAVIASGIPNGLEIDMLSNAKAKEALVAVQNRLSSILRVMDDKGGKDE